MSTLLVCWYRLDILLLMLILASCHGRADVVPCLLVDSARRDTVGMSVSVRVQYVRVGCSGRSWYVYLYRISHTCCLVQCDLVVIMA